MARFVERYLAPGERLGELLFGFIMTLTFTLSAGVVIGEEEGAVRDLLIATVGCNIAWGIIDGCLLVLGRVFERGRAARIGHFIRTGGDDENALALVADELDEQLGSITSETTRLSLYREIIARVKENAPASPRARIEDWLAALAVFWLVFFASLPAALPFLVLDDPWVALRASNAILIGLVFFIGYKWATYTTLHPWAVATKLAAGCVLLVLIAIPLGG